MPRRASIKQVSWQLNATEEETADQIKDSLPVVVTRRRRSSIRQEIPREILTTHTPSHTKLKMSEILQTSVDEEEETGQDKEEGVRRVCRHISEFTVQPVLGSELSKRTLVLAIPRP